MSMEYSANHEVSAWSMSTSSTGKFGLHHGHPHAQDRFEVRYKMEGDDDYDDKSSVPTAPPIDLNKIYASARVRRGNKTRSMSSFTTEWSTSTAQISNTTTKREAKKQQKRRFLLFTKILMKLLERKDPTVYYDAQVVIHDCEEKKKKGEAESVVESLRTPLKGVVGPEYWNEARTYSKRVLNAKKEVPDDASDDEILAFNMTDLTFLSGFAPSVTPSYKNSSTTREENVRKKRLWMIICVFMKYLMRTDTTLYFQAKALVSECVRRHRRGDEGYRSLSGSIQSCLKKEIGAGYWKRAEGFVAQFLLSNNPSTTGSPLGSGGDSSWRKRTNDLNSFERDQKRQRFFEI
jgi:hypothetical protein